PSSLAGKTGHITIAIILYIKIEYTKRRIRAISKYLEKDILRLHIQTIKKAPVSAANGNRSQHLFHSQSNHLTVLYSCQTLMSLL
uniref:hypothetical protein n=2 Tax=Phascolarctobacterium faecium TaxID=33025 RepID=UPI003AB18836